MGVLGRAGAITAAHSQGRGDLYSIHHHSHHSALARRSLPLPRAFLRSGPAWPSAVLCTQTLRDQ